MPVTSSPTHAIRLRRIRRTVAAGSVALFVASLATVMAFGRQPAPGATAATPAAPGYGGDDGSGSYGGDDGGYDAQPYGSGTQSSQPQSQAPAPLTSRSS